MPKLIYPLILIKGQLIQQFKCERNLKTFLKLLCIKKNNDLVYRI